MLQQRTLISLGALAAVAILAFITLRSPEKGERVGPRDRPIPALKAADVKELSIASQNGKDQVVLKNDGGKWQLVQPMQSVADQALVKTAVDQLEKVDFADVVTDKKESFDKFEVGDDKGAHVVAKDAGGKVLFDAWIGKSVSGFTMLRPAGAFGQGDKGNQVWQATGLFKYTYAREPKMWRDHSILSFDRNDVTRLAVSAGGQHITLEKLAPEPGKDATKEPGKDKPAGDAAWKVTDTSVKVEPLDESVPNQMVNTLASLVAAEFDDAAKPADAGTANPRETITVTVKGAPTSLLIGNTKGDDNWVQVEGRPQIYVLHKYTLERLLQRPIDFRDKTLVKAREDEIASIDIVDGADKITLVHDKEWAAQGGKPEIDPAKAKGVAGAFGDLKGATFADPAEAAAGMAKVAGEVTLHRKDKSTVAIKIGETTKDGQDVFAQKVGSPDVVMLKKFQVDRFLKKASDLGKSATPPLPPKGPRAPMGAGMPRLNAPAPR